MIDWALKLLMSFKSAVITQIRNRLINMIKNKWNFGIKKSLNDKTKIKPLSINDDDLGKAKKYFHNCGKTLLLMLIKNNKANFNICLPPKV